MYDNIIHDIIILYLIMHIELESNTYVSSYAAEWTTSGEMQVLFARNVDMEVRKAILVEAYGARMYAGKHKAKERYSTLSAGVPPKLILRGLVLQQWQECRVSICLRIGGYSNHWMGRRQGPIAAVHQ